MGTFLAWWGKYGTPVSTLTGFIGTVAVVVSWFAATTAKEVIYAIGLVLVFVGGAATFAILSVRLGQRARYAEAFANVREAIHKIVVEGLAEFHTHEERGQALSAAMDDLSKAFSILTGSNCRCCIKTVVLDGTTDPKGLLVGTLCRNSDYKDQDAPHPIQFNTDFNDLYQDKSKTWFLANDLPEMAKAGKYQNTNSAWMARYRSTVIWPIRRAAGAKLEYPELLGFLCVDSKRTRAFSEEYDYPLGAIVADALYPFLLRIANETKQSAPSGTAILTEQGKGSTPQGAMK